jgi:membrane associated rhomboid family serine protease
LTGIFGVAATVRVVATELTTCYRHGDRRAGVSCQRCGRPICASCMTQASVGFHCPECVQRQGQKVYRAADLRARPVVTLALIGLNVAVFVLDLVLRGGGGAFGTGTGALADNGLLVGLARQGNELVGVAAGESYRIVTGGFLHAGLLHLGMNMLVLWIIGGQLEPALGKSRYLALYVTSLFAGAFGVLLVSPTSPTVGASGAVFGLMGAAVAAQRARGINPWQSGLGGLIGINVLITFLVPGISIGGHLGGLVGGLVAGFVIFQLDEKVRSPVPAVLACAAMSVALWFGCLWAADQWADPVLGFLGR